MTIHEPIHDNTEMRIRGTHERQATDTSALSIELQKNHDLTTLNQDFDNGLTTLRDVGGMLTAQRDSILRFYEAGTIETLIEQHRILLEGPVKSLHSRVVDGERDQPIGHNFFVNATGFITGNRSWANDLDALITARTGATIHDISQSDDYRGKDELLQVLTKNPDEDMLRVLAVYLAGRSREGERFLESKYGP